MATLFNLCGLAVAFAAFMTILMQVEYDYTFDHFDPNYSRIFRVEFVHKEGGVQAILSRPMIETLIASSPHIQAGTYQNMDYDFVFSIENGADKKKFRELYQTVSPGFTDVFHFDFVEGSPDVLKTPDQVMIPESMARKIFGQESAVGKKLINPTFTPTVGAVYRDFPDNTLVSNVIYHAISEQENKTNWGNWNYTAFIRVDDAANLPTIEENFKKHFTNVLKEQFGAEGVAEWEAVGADLRFTPLPDVHFVSNVQFDSMPKANAQALHVLTAIAFVVLLIAGINFTNFSIALTPMRIRSINTQKVLGSSVGNIRRALVAESILISLAAYILAVGLVVLFARSPLSALVTTDLGILSHKVVVGATAFIALCTGLAAGIYPAFYMTSFSPALILKGSFGLSTRGRALRNALIGVQYFASFALIIGAGCMYLQNHFMQHAPLGYERDQIIIAELSDEGRLHPETFMNKIKSYAGVSGITRSEQILSSADSYMTWGRDYRGKRIDYVVIPVEASFLDVLGIPAIEGRTFRTEDALTRHGAYVFNERAKQEYGLELGTMIDSTGMSGPLRLGMPVRDRVVPAVPSRRGPGCAGVDPVLVGEVIPHSGAGGGDELGGTQSQAEVVVTHGHDERHDHGIERNKGRITKQRRTHRSLGTESEQTLQGIGEEEGGPESQQRGEARGKPEDLPEDVQEQDVEGEGQAPGHQIAQRTTVQDPGNTQINPSPKPQAALPAERRPSLTQPSVARDPGNPITGW